MDALVSTAWLAQYLTAHDLRVLDVRWSLTSETHGREAYAAGHIPGAVFVDVERDLSAPGGARGGPLGRHPWPGPTQVERVMSRLGVDEHIRVVAYDDQSGAIAARVWFLLRAYGHDGVAVLDGGIQKWQAECRPLETAPVMPSARRFRARPAEGWVMDKMAMRQRDPSVLVWDARAPERFRGEIEPVDPRAGHIPGARNAPFTDNLTADRVPIFLPVEVLRERYAALGGERRPIVYCGSGLTACHDLLALHLSGLSGRLYAGSWSEWSADPELPVETGPARS